MAQLQLEWNVSPKVYVGSLVEGTTKEDLSEVFQRYGKIKEIRMFSSESSSAFAFVEFEEDSMAENAVRALGDPTIGLSKAKKIQLELMEGNMVGGFARGRGGRGGGFRGGFRGAAAPSPAAAAAARGYTGRGGFWRDGGIVEGTLDTSNATREGSSGEGNRVAPPALHEPSQRR